MVGVMAREGSTFLGSGCRAKDSGASPFVQLPASCIRFSSDGLGLDLALPQLVLDGAQNTGAVQPQF